MNFAFCLPSYCQCFRLSPCYPISRFLQWLWFIPFFHAPHPSANPIGSIFKTYPKSNHFHLLGLNHHHLSLTLLQATSFLPFFYYSITLHVLCSNPPVAPIPLRVKSKFPNMAFQGPTQSPLPIQLHLFSSPCSFFSLATLPPFFLNYTRLIPSSRLSPPSVPFI